MQLKNHMFIAGYFMMFFDLTPDHAASEGHVSLPDQGNIRRTSVWQGTCRCCHVSTTPRNTADRSTAHCFRRLL